jgi:hypothetical protein
MTGGKRHDELGARYPQQTPLILVVALARKITAQYVTLVVEYPSDAAVAAPDLLPVHARRGQCFQGGNTERVTLGQIERQVDGVEGNNAVQRFETAGRRESWVKLDMTALLISSKVR